MSEPIDDVLLTGVDVARVLNISRATAYKIMGDGTLPAFRIGMRTLRISKAALQKWIVDQGKQHSGAASERTE